MGTSDIEFDRATLLLSEGKDSTGIALAIAELGKKVDCMTFANSDTNIDYVESLANRLGFRLTVVRYSDMRISDDSLDRLGNVFEPTLDQAFLSYLLLPMASLHGRTILDGMGNDIYMGHLPSKQQRQATAVCHALTKWMPSSLRNRLRDMRCTDHPSTGVPFRSFTECQGFFNGFSQSLIESSTCGKIEKLCDVDKNWNSMGFEQARALSRGRFLDNYSYSGKSVALAEMIQGRVVFPWCDQSLANRFSTIKNEARFQWPSVNKLLLREAISKRMDYEQPKVGFRAPVARILSENRKLLEYVIDHSETLGPRMKPFLLGLAPHSPRLACGFLYALWEHSLKPHSEGRGNALH
ncbi:hypothetical protein [Rubripirellula tenax]|nr:hypothetical protein [Rubripirellula tenax]